MLKYSRLNEDSWLRWAADSIDEAKICIMGVPFDGAVSLEKGAAKGPETIRNLSIDLSDVAEDFVPIKEKLLYDIGDIVPELNWEKYFRRVEDEAFELISRDKFCLFLGGDHSVTIPLHKAFGRYHKEKLGKEKIGVIHFDAHYDLCPEYDGHKWSHACTEARALEGLVNGQDLFFVGIRVAELSEFETMEKHPGIRTIKAEEVNEKGCQYVVSELEKHFKDYDAIYLTLDIDVLDPAFAPGTGTPVAGGLTSRELINIFKKIIRSLPIKAMDIVEVAPPLDVNNITSWAALRIIHEVFTVFSK